MGIRRKVEVLHNMVGAWMGLGWVYDAVGEVFVRRRGVKRGLDRVERGDREEEEDKGRFKRLRRV